MAEPFVRAGRALALALLLIAPAACRSQEDQLREHRRQLHSLRSTAIQVGDAWVAGQVSSTYAVAALETTSRLLEKERTSFGSAPERLADPSVGALLTDVDAAAQSVGALIHDIESSTQDAVRQRLANLAADGSRP